MVASNTVIRLKANIYMPTSNIVRNLIKWEKFFRYLTKVKRICSNNIPKRLWFVAVVYSLSHVWLFATSWTAGWQASLSFTVSQSLLKVMSIESMMPSNHLILCHPLLLLPSIFPSIRDFSNDSALWVRWPKVWSFSISPSNEYSGLIFSLGLTVLISLLYKGLSRVFSSSTIQQHQLFYAQPLWSNAHISSWLLEEVFGYSNENPWIRLSQEGRLMVK